MGAGLRFMVLRRRLVAPLARASAGDRRDHLVRSIGSSGTRGAADPESGDAPCVARSCVERRLHFTPALSSADVPFHSMVARGAAWRPMRDPAPEMDASCWLYPSSEQKRELALEAEYADLDLTSSTTAGRCPGSAEKPPRHQGRQRGVARSAPTSSPPISLFLGALGALAVRFPALLPAVVLACLFLALCFTGCGGYSPPQDSKVCTPGSDQTCNDNPAISSLHGVCESDGTCTCKDGYTKNPKTGRCL
jgi:hypothetical protein